MDFCVALSRENKDKRENMMLARELLTLGFINNNISCQQQEQRKCTRQILCCV